jgi:hypothetical protein
MFLLKDGRVVGGGIQYGWQKSFGKLKGVPTGEPAVKKLTSAGYVWEKPMRPPTQTEQDEWYNDYVCWSEVDGSEIGKTPVEEVTVLCVIPVCGECEESEVLAPVDDYLCVKCRAR